MNPHKVICFMWPLQVVTLKMVPNGKSLFSALCVTVVLCTCSVSSQLSHDHIIYVDNENGSNTEGCLINSGMFSPCATLQHAVSGLRNLTQILFSPGSHSIDQTINISALHSISLAGMNTDSGSTTVYCENSSNAGLKFVEVSDLRISKLVFVNCGSLSASTTRGEDFEMMAKFRIAVFILNSTDVYIESTTFINNRGVGLALFDTNGHVYVLNSDFTSNSVPQEEKLHKYSGGGGLYIEHTYCTPGLVKCNNKENSFNSNSTMVISNCCFTDNLATTLPRTSSTLVHQEKIISRRLGQGAAISLTLKGTSSGNNITISSCSFKNNSARYGGAVNINFQDYATENRLFFKNCTFVKNHAKDGGGGLFVGIFFYEADTVIGNHIHLKNISFINNTRIYGGGAHFAISRMRNSNLEQNSISFADCEWKNNSARLGGALLLVPEAWNTFTDGSLPVPVFTNCNFIGNWISTSHADSPSNSTLSTEGVVFSSTISMNFTGNVMFNKNNGTALSIAGGSINILNNAFTKFESNSGTRGGALVLLDFASLRVFPGSEVSFMYNTATEFGGAIYASSHNDLDFYFSRSCFIHYSDVRVPIRHWKAKITFKHNYVGQLNETECSRNDTMVSVCTTYSPPKVPTYDIDRSNLTKGNSIYAESVQPCIRTADTTGNFTPTDDDLFPDHFPFESGVFQLIEYCNTGRLCGIGTAPNSLVVGELDSNGMLTMAPGEKKRLRLEVKDELNHTVNAAVSVYVPKSNKYHVDRSSFYVTDDTVQINGHINEVFKLTLSTDGPKQVSIIVNAQLTACPPGLVYNNSSLKCICSATTENQRLEGITKCSVDEFRGLLNKGYWAGCYGQLENESLLTAECPLGYCGSTDSADHSRPFYVLPETCEQLDSFLCGPQNRSGNLCGMCKANHSVFFHSQRFNCHECNYKYGILYYILSELVPVTLLFLCIVSFNIHLTSGTWNSVILYAQIIDCFQVNSLQLFEPPHGILELTSIYQFIFGWFNFDFFKFDDYLSFCIWDGMTVLDVLAFKYVTTGFALSLLILLILCFRCQTQCWDKCETAWKQCQRATGSSQHHRSWIIHGISAFLVLSYAQCTKVSFQILTNVYLRGKNSEAVKRVVFLSGNVEYFSLAHLPYAIPALLTLILTTIPPTVLLLYPLKNSIGSCNMDRVQQFCINEHYKCWSVISMTRFKPLIDSFQGCFKDRYRYFAGLFFIYRFLMSLSFALSTNAVTLYVTLEVLLIAMLSLHAWAQPYEQRFYNLLDTFMFANLAVVNALSIYNFYWVNYSSNTTNLTVSLAFQVILIYLPILYLLVMCFFLILTGYSKKARRCFRKLNNHVPLFEESAEDLEESLTHSRTESVPFDEEHLPYRMFKDK